MVACARWWGMHVWVYVAGEGGVGFERVAEFEAPESVAGGRSMEGRLERTAHVLFRNANHYDALEPDDRELRRALGVTRVGGGDGGVNGGTQVGRAITAQVDDMDA